MNGLGVSRPSYMLRNGDQKVVSSQWLNKLPVNRLFNAVSDALITVNDHGHLVDINSAARHLLHISNDKVVGSNINVLAFAGFVLVDGDDRVWLNWQDFIDENDDNEIRIYRPDGTFIYIQYKKQMNIAPGMHLLILHVLGESMLSERHSKSSQGHKGRPLLSKLRLSSILMHEFRNSLNIISISNYMLQKSDEGKEDQRQTHDIQRIEHQVHRMRDLLDDILNADRLETWGTKMVNVPIDLEKLCVQVANEMEGHLSSQQQIIFDKQGWYPAFEGDPHLLKYVLTNLISNAIKYSPQNGKIRVSLSRDNGEIALKIEDEGIGIPKDDIPHIFDAFYRGGNVDKASGSGLGLFIAQTIVENHEGRITCSSEHGMGTTFTVYLPGISKDAS